MIINALDPAMNGTQASSLFGQDVANLNTLFEQASTCYDAKVTGKATPEHSVSVEFAATSEGEYDIRCTKFWGIKHWSENGKIVVERGQRVR